MNAYQLQVKEGQRLVIQFRVGLRQAIAAYQDNVDSIAFDIAQANPELDQDDIETAVYEHFYGDEKPYGVTHDVYRTAAYRALGGAA